MSKLLEDLKILIEKNSEKRTNWNDYFMSIALLISSRSPSEKLKVGSVIVSDNRILSSGYNGFPANTPHESIHRDGHEINTIHSEINSICDAGKRGVNINNSTIYITHYPCINCCKSIISCGIKKIIYLNDYKNDEVVDILLKNSKIEILQLQ
jgi:dCMP deaminase